MQLEVVHVALLEARKYIIKKRINIKLRAKEGRLYIISLDIHFAISLLPLIILLNQNRAFLMQLETAHAKDGIIQKNYYKSIYYCCTKVNEISF